MTWLDVLHKGGDWLGAARHWLQWNKHNGDTVTWGSVDEIKPPMTVLDCETLAAEAVAAERERCAKLMDRFEATYEHNGPTQVSEMFKAAGKQIREG